MPPSRMNRSVQSTNHTIDNTTNIIITETSTKTFYRYYFPIRNMLQNNFSHAIFFREGVMSRNRIIRRLRTSMLQPHGFFFFVIIDLHFMAKWRSPSFKYRRGFDLLANVLKIQQRTLGRCSYFQFVSSRLAIYSKP